MLLRHLLNYVGSAFALADHTRNQLATYEGAQWVVVDASDMLSWRKCPAPAKKYLSESRSIRILDLVQEYENSLGELYEWVFAQYQILHGGDTAEFQDLVQKLEAAYRPVSTFPLDASDEWSLKLHLRD